MSAINCLMRKISSCGGVHCLIRSGRGSSSFETGSAEFCGTVHEDATSS